MGTFYFYGFRRLLEDSVFASSVSESLVTCRGPSEDRGQALLTRTYTLIQAPTIPGALQLHDPLRLDD